MLSCDLISRDLIFFTGETTHLQSVITLFSQIEMQVFSSEEVRLNVLGMNDSRDEHFWRSFEILKKWFIEEII